MQNKNMNTLANDEDYLKGLNAVDQAIASRFSVRAFLSKPVPRQKVEHILEIAAWAPSGTNMQPWQVYVVSGATQKKLSDAIREAFFMGEAGHSRGWKYYPDDFFEPFKSRRRKCGIGLYQTLGIGKGETEKMKNQRARNYAFFDAPVGFIYTIHKDLEIGSWMDLGMFLQNVMVSARGQGLHTCPQAAFSDYHKIIRDHLGVPDDEIVVCGMSIGYADPNAVVNSFRPEREPVSEFANFEGFEDKS